MSKKFDNKKLIIVLVVLGAIWGLTEIFSQKEKTLKTDIVTFSSDEVAKIELYARGEQKAVVLNKKGEDDWSVSKEDKHFKSTPEIVNSYLEELQKIKSQRLAARSKDKWEEYQLTDSMATKIKVYNQKGKELLNILIGKFSYKQLQSSNPYSKNNIKGISYVRLAGENEIYAVDGFLPMSLNRGFDDWRDKTLAKFNKKDVKTIQFTYPDSSFILQLKDSVWYINNMLADAKKVEEYLSSMENKNGFAFNNDFKSSSNPVYQLKIEGDNLTNIQVKCFEAGEGKFAIQSSQNTEASFDSDDSGLIKQIFKSQQDFLTKEENN